MADLIGQRLGQYEIISLLGKGGMAKVYRARQVNVRRDVAIKVIESRLVETPEFVRRFEREAQTIANLNHPFILKLFDFGQHDDLLYLVMELQQGGSLNARIREQGPLSGEQTARYLDQISEALDYAHERGIIHRDLKPQNVLLDERGNAILTDFGIARIVDANTTALTGTGIAMGTPGYMAPEQWYGKDVDSRTDEYALAIMTYEMLTGKTPFVGDTPANVMYMHLNVSPPSLRTSRPDLPPAVDVVLNKALAKDPDQRFQTAADFAKAFRTALSGSVPAGMDATFKQPVPPPSGSVPVWLESAAKQPAQPTTARRSRAPLMAGGLLLIVVAIAIIGALAARNNGGTASPTAVVMRPTDISGLPSMTPTQTPSLTESATESLETRVKAAFATQTQAQALVIASYTKTNTPDLDQTIRAIVNATNTAVAISSFTKTATVTSTFTRTHTATVTPTFTRTQTATVTPTFTRTATATATPSPNGLPAANGPLVIWVDPTRGDSVKALADVFATKYNLKVSVAVMDFNEIHDKYLVAAVAGVPPDILLGSSDWLVEFAERDLLAPVQLSGRILDNVDNIARNLFTYRRQLYALPTDYGGIALYYNKDLVSTPPATFEDMLTKARSLQSNSLAIQRGLVIPFFGYFYYPIFTAFDGRIFGVGADQLSDRTQVMLDSPETLEGAKYLVRLFNEGYLTNTDYSTTQELFTSKKAAMYIDGPWAVGTLRYAGINFGVAKLPPIRAGVPLRLYGSGNGFMLSKGKNVALAQYFISTMLATDVAMNALFNTNPSLSAWLPTRALSAAADYQMFAEALVNVDAVPPIPEMNAAWNEIDTALNRIYNKEVSAEAAFKDAAIHLRDTIAMNPK